MSAPLPPTRLVVPFVTGLALLLSALLLPAPAQAANRVTPGDFTGYGFDQCVTPTQSAMDAWLRSSPFWAVGIYTSGDSRGCRTQPNQTPQWVETQLRNGWRLLPITLGPQASCNPSFPRYRDDVRINPSSANNYAAAKAQARAEAVDAVAAARRLGIGPGSTLWYDMEAYDISITSCRESALHFTSAWTRKLHRLDYVSGVYSSAGSGLKAMDDARVQRPDAFTEPDQIWIARWDGVANTSTSYLRSDGWMPGGRMKQYRGGHTETWGSVTINIDSNWLDLGRGSTAPAEPDHCGGVRLNFSSYAQIGSGATGPLVRAAQCLLKGENLYSGPMDGVLDGEVMDAVLDWRAAHGMPSDRWVGSRVWVGLHSPTTAKLIKVGARGERVRKLQRALNAVSGGSVSVTGVLDRDTAASVASYQRRVGLQQSGVVTPETWQKLGRGIL
ncbi:DUF1906 domain-containing protein [Nocardioides sp. HDW12B]|uniref:glycoside hydrolase domain-containing protein n=1 Tax=Nocardioides sp. HDW12B TaxID=2714939 RepID=UPI00140E1ABC|nr:glycoside hydrolase domain-containing protein [Nocardioides sp. HDW12B]QIK68164.1 DUF1906 domain-containing protein [Nocardioides sp. HDW12B]